METIKLDISKTGIAVSAEMQAKAQAANALLESGKGAGNDFLGWYTSRRRSRRQKSKPSKNKPRNSAKRPRSSSASASGVRTWAPRPCSKP